MSVMIFRVPDPIIECVVCCRACIISLESPIGKNDNEGVIREIGRLSYLPGGWAYLHYVDGHLTSGMSYVSSVQQVEHNRLSLNNTIYRIQSSVPVIPEVELRRPDGGWSCHYQGHVCFMTRETIALYRHISRVLNLS